MIRSWNPRWWLLSLIVIMAWPGAGASALELVDDRGVRVVLDQPPQRIVSLLPSLTEMVCDLGQCRRLVGVDRYSNYPAHVHSLPKVGGGLDPSLELIVGLRPDLVLLATSSPAVGRLESLGLKVVAFEPKQYSDVQRVLQHIGILLAVPDAPALWRKIEDAVAATARSLPPGVAGRRVYFEVNSAPYAAGTASFIGETLHRLGVENIVPASLGPFPKINPEFVVRADPDLIMVGDATYGGMAQRPGWSRMRAIREGKVCVYTPAQSDLMVRAGPRMAEAAQTMADCLRRHLP
jgi:iron complex transport system substrate-binding protein